MFITKMSLFSTILEVDTRHFFLYCCFHKIKITCHSNLSKIFMKKKIQMQIHNRLSLQWTTSIIKKRKSHIQNRTTKYNLDFFLKKFLHLSFALVCQFNLPVSFRKKKLFPFVCNRFWWFVVSTCAFNSITRRISRRMRTC